MPRPRPALVLLALVTLVGCDQVTKHAATTGLDDGPISVVPGVLDLRYAENPGVAFNLERLVPTAAHRPLVAFTALLAAIALVAAWRRRDRIEPRAAWGGALIGAGALGNLLDRANHGAVVDFIHVHHWPIFNLADTWIVIGVGLLMWSSARPQHRAGTQPRG